MTSKAKDRFPNYESICLQCGATIYKPATVKQLSDERIAEIWEYAKQTALNTRGGIVELIFSRAIIKEITE